MMNKKKETFSKRSYFLKKYFAKCIYDLLDAGFSKTLYFM